MTIEMSGVIRQSIHVITKALQNDAAKRREALCLLYALGAMLAVLTWQAATVHFNYEGNWTALFMTGDLHPPPPELAGHTYVFKASTGYDGQFYRYVAHAPWFRADWARYYDAPRLRHYRILIPALAWLLAAGRDQCVDGVYVALILGWILLGTYWLGRYAVDEGHNPAWGLAFPLLPATLTSIDRMTVDVALAALCVAFVRYAKKESSARLYLVLVLAVLVRETGALLIAAQCLYDLAGKRWRRAAGFATAILPAAAWYAYVWDRSAMLAVAHPEKHLQPAGFLPHWFFQYPAIGIFMKLFQPEQYPFSPWLNHGLQAADTLALCGFLTLVAMAVWSLRRRPWDVEQWAVLCFLALVLATSSPDFWGQVYTYARPFSPLVFLAALRPLRNRSPWAIAPVLSIALRVVAQMAPQACGVVHGLW
jgi:hypothetical protein